MTAATQEPVTTPTAPAHAPATPAAIFNTTTTATIAADTTPAIPAAISADASVFHTSAGAPARIQGAKSAPLPSTTTSPAPELRANRSLGAMLKPAEPEVYSHAGTSKDPHVWLGMASTLDQTSTGIRVGMCGASSAASSQASGTDADSATAAALAAACAALGASSACSSVGPGMTNTNTTITRATSTPGCISEDDFSTRASSPAAVSSAGQLLSSAARSLAGLLPASGSLFGLGFVHAPSQASSAQGSPAGAYHIPWLPSGSSLAAFGIVTGTEDTGVGDSAGGLQLPNSSSLGSSLGFVPGSEDDLYEPPATLQPQQHMPADHEAHSAASHDGPPQHAAELAQQADAQPSAEDVQGVPIELYELQREHERATWYGPGLPPSIPPRNIEINLFSNAYLRYRALRQLLSRYRRDVTRYMSWQERVKTLHPRQYAEKKVRTES